MRCDFCIKLFRVSYKLQHDFWAIEKGRNNIITALGETMVRVGLFSCFTSTLLCFCSCWSFKVSKLGNNSCSCKLQTQKECYQKNVYEYCMCFYCHALTASSHSWTYNLTFRRKLRSCLCLFINKKYRFHLFKLANFCEQNFHHREKLRQ